MSATSPLEDPCKPFLSLLYVKSSHHTTSGSAPRAWRGSTWPWSACYSAASAPP